MTTLFKLLASAVLVAVTVQINAQAPINGLVAFYPFNGNTADASGNGLNGTNQGAILTTDRAGLQNSAYRFNGNSWIRLPDAVSTVSPQEFTISLWVLADGGPYASQQMLMGFSTRTGEAGMSVQPDGWTFGAHLQTSGWYGDPAPKETNTWTHLVATFRKGQSIQHWVNGVLRKSTAIPNEDLYLSSYPLNAAIGIYDYSGGRFQGFVGAIDDVRIYNRALSNGEIGQIYAAEGNITPTISLIKAVKPSFSNLMLGTNYQLQLSGNLSGWTNQGAPFVATNVNMVYPQYWDVENWSGLYFRLQVAE